MVTVAPIQVIRGDEGGPNWLNYLSGLSGIANNLGLIGPAKAQADYYKAQTKAIEGANEDRLRQIEANEELLLKEEAVHTLEHEGKYGTGPINLNQPPQITADTTPQDSWSMVSGAINSMPGAERFVSPVLESVGYGINPEAPVVPDNTTSDMVTSKSADVIAAAKEEDNVKAEMGPFAAGEFGPFLTEPQQRDLNVLNDIVLNTKNLPPEAVANAEEAASKIKAIGIMNTPTEAFEAGLNQGTQVRPLAERLFVAKQSLQRSMLKTSLIAYGGKVPKELFTQLTQSHEIAEDAIRNELFKNGYIPPIVAQNPNLLAEAGHVQNALSLNINGRLSREEALKVTGAFKDRISSYTPEAQSFLMRYIMSGIESNSRIKLDSSKLDMMQQQFNSQLEHNMTLAKLQNETQRYGIDKTTDIQKYGIDISAATQNRSLSIQEKQLAKDYNFKLLEHMQNFGYKTMMANKTFNLEESKFLFQKNEALLTREFNIAAATSALLPHLNEMERLALANNAQRSQLFKVTYDKYDPLIAAATAEKAKYKAGSPKYEESNRKVVGLINQRDLVLKDINTNFPATDSTTAKSLVLQTLNIYKQMNDKNSEEFKKLQLMNPAKREEIKQRAAEQVAELKFGVENPGKIKQGVAGLMLGSKLRSQIPKDKLKLVTFEMFESKLSKELDNPKLDPFTKTQIKRYMALTRIDRSWVFVGIFPSENMNVEDSKPVPKPQSKTGYDFR